MRQNVWAKCMRAAGKHLTKDLVKVSLGVLLRRCPSLQFLLVPGGAYNERMCTYTEQRRVGGIANAGAGAQVRAKLQVAAASRSVSHPGQSTMQVGFREL